MIEESLYLLMLAEFSATEVAIRKKAAEIHEGVNQHYDEHPYSVHLNAVAYHTARYLREVLISKDDVLPVLFGAYFHDSIEDARLTYHDVMKIACVFMSKEQAYKATEIVYALTNEKGRNRHERANDKYYDLIKATPYAPLVKACDRLANYEYAKSTHSRMAAMYEGEMDDFLVSLSAHNAAGVFAIPQSLIDELRKTE